MMTAHPGLRILMISHGYAPRIGGAERQVGALSSRLRAQGLDVQVLTRRLPGTTAYEVLDDVPVYRLPAPGPKITASIIFTLACLKQIGRLKPDLIHAHELISPSTTALLARALYGIPTLVTIHGSGQSSEIYRLRRRTFGKARLKLLCKYMDMFVVISQKIAAELDEENVPAERRIHIPNGVDTAQFNPVPAPVKRSVRVALGLPVDAVIAVYIGRLAPEKNVAQLVEIWPAVHAQVPQSELVIVGGGPLETNLRQQAGAGIRFVGFQQDVQPYLTAADVFVLPSNAEGLSVALLEAMASGLAVVATAVGGTPEVIADGETGCLVPPGDGLALAQALLKVLQDPLLREQLGQNARRRVQSEYALEQVAQRLADLYSHVVKKGK
jgi:glycosyltransferase involved in cell wall biosynthesis